MRGLGRYAKAVSSPTFFVFFKNECIFLGGKNNFVFKYDPSMNNVKFGVRIKNKKNQNSNLFGVEM